MDTERAEQVSITMSPTFRQVARAAADFYGVALSEVLRTALLEKLTREGLLEKLKAGQGGT